MSYSLDEAKKFFNEKALPRKVRDFTKEGIYREKFGYEKKFYRRVMPDESDRGTSYPICTSGINMLSHFGIGVGLYFFQLISLSFVIFFSSFALIPAFKFYTNRSQSTKSLLSLTASSVNFISVNATVNCPNGESICQVSYCEHCDLPRSLVVGDIVMCVFIIVFILFTKYIDSRFEEQLDEAILSSQDYSIVVLDPDEDATDPDEWFRFFSRFGKVKYITVAKKNKNLGIILAKKEKLLRKLDYWKNLKSSSDGEIRIEIKAPQTSHVSDSGEISSPGRFCFWLFSYGISRISACFSPVVTFVVVLIRDVISLFQMNIDRNIDKCNEGLASIDELIRLEFHKKYGASKVFVTFEYEEQQRLALHELEVPDLYAYMDRGDSVDLRNVFRGRNVLDVVEAPEPDNVIWSNIEFSSKSISFRMWISRAIVLGFLVACYYCVELANSFKNSSTILPIVIGVIDTFIPTIFYYITSYEVPSNEGVFQESLQIKLFSVRLVLSTIFPYLSTKWNLLITPTMLLTILNVQIAACFSDPIQKLLDLPNIFYRNIAGPMMISSQEELNGIWIGSGWSLAERYTGISKILFVSLFYSFLSPISLPICALALVLTFFIDRFLLLRRWRQPVMMDAQVSFRLRQQTILAVAGHMYSSLRILYSWPMDEASPIPGSQDYSYVDKSPSFNVFVLLPQSWQSIPQQRGVRLYRMVTLVFLGFAAIYWVILPLVNCFHRLFFKTYKTTGECSGVPFSSLSRISCYVPTLKYQYEKYFFAHLSNVQSQHIPTFISPSNRVINLSELVPMAFQSNLLSIVKYYDSIESSRLLQASADSGASFLQSQAKSKSVGSIQQDKVMNHLSFFRHRMKVGCIDESDCDNNSQGNVASKHTPSDQQFTSPTELGSTSLLASSTQLGSRLSQCLDMNNALPKQEEEIDMNIILSPTLTNIDTIAMKLNSTHVSLFSLEDRNLLRKVSFSFSKYVFA